MVFYGELKTTQQLTQVPAAGKELLAKNLIVRAWRERWDDVQWGIHVRTIMEDDEDASFMADCILQQALNGPGPNNLVLSYLSHSLHSQIISTAAVLKSISQYDGYHKPYCIFSLLKLLDDIKNDMILHANLAEPSYCLELALSLEATIHWLLTCMYSSLESLSDLSFPDASSAEGLDSEEVQTNEDSKIVVKCRELIVYILQNEYLSSLVFVASQEDKELFTNIEKMCKEVGKFSESRHKQDIYEVNRLIEELKQLRSKSISQAYNLVQNIPSLKDTKILVGTPLIQTIVTFSAVLKSHYDMSNICEDLMIAKDLKKMDVSSLVCEITQSCFGCLVDAIGTDHEFRVLGFIFLLLPTILQSIKEQINASQEDFETGLLSFVKNESVTSIVDMKLRCNTIEHFLSCLCKFSLIEETSKSKILESQRKKYNGLAIKQNSSNTVQRILKAETTLISVLKTLDGDYVKNQDAILSVLSDMKGKSLELLLTAAAYTGRLQQLTSRLIDLNQSSRQVTGEGSKSSATRAMIFDISFLMLCHIVQVYGDKSLAPEPTNSFFEEWYRDCMVEEDSPKDPAVILTKCDQKKVELLLNQYMQGDTELNTSLVFWHELCTNAVGLVNHLLLAWSNDTTNFPDIKKTLDVFRTRICSLTVCIASWLCSYISIMPANMVDKARCILNHLLSSTGQEESQENFRDRFTLMGGVINKMMETISASKTFDTDTCISEVYQKCSRSMMERSSVDIDTLISINTLRRLCESQSFLTQLITEMMDLPYTVEMVQRYELLCGVLQLDLANLVPALISIVVPTLLHHGDKLNNFIEPQIKILAALAVDCLILYFKHIKPVKIEKSDDLEPPKVKRRRLNLSVETGENTENSADLEIMLKDLYDDFEQVLSVGKAVTPQVTFVLRFLEQLAAKTPNLDLLHYMNPSAIDKLLNIVSEEMTTPFILKLYCLDGKTGRENCAFSICSLYELSALDQEEEIV